MLRFVSTLALLLAGCALSVLLVCALALRLLFSIAFALSGVRRHPRGERVLDW